MFGFSIKEILPHVYHLHFESAYDLAMHFWRFQEYYESTMFHRKIVSLVDYMEWFAQAHGDGAFTYATEWSGFNVPSWALHSLRESTVIPDLNKYDQRMFTLIDWVQEKEGKRDFYFIGSSSEGHQGDGDEEGVLDHEIAHALFSTCKDYRSRVYDLLTQWREGRGHKGEELDSARVVLEGEGYHGSVVSDEIHAYCATELSQALTGVISEQEMKPFQALLKEFKEKCKSDALK